MNILIYKRTHVGDPGPDGCFGVYDCMGVVRDRDYDAVIGVGGIGLEAQSHGIARTVNWIGVGPHKTYTDKRGPDVTFDRFVYYGCDGYDFANYAPILAERMYGRNVRSILRGLTDAEHAEALAIVAWADDAMPSPLLVGDAGDEPHFTLCKGSKKPKCNFAGCPPNSSGCAGPNPAVGRRWPRSCHNAGQSPLQIALQNIFSSVAIPIVMA